MNFRGGVVEDLVPSVHPALEVFRAKGTGMLKPG